MQLALKFKKHEETDTFRFIENGIEADGHTLVYKMHKYFARRPHNVFRWLIDFYSQQNDIVLDCFCGGGVTLFEGISTGRKVVAVDRNPLATFISDCQTTVVSVQEYSHELLKLRDLVSTFIRPFFTTACRDCGVEVDVRWYEMAYLVKCGSCGSKASLADENKISNGSYKCHDCQKEISAADARRIGQELLWVIYRCRRCKKQSRVRPSDMDQARLADAESQFTKLVSKHKLWYPTDPIPGEWDRQAEDCLHRKGFLTFDDFFTRRHLLALAYFLKQLRKQKPHLDPQLYKLLLFTFSAILRHTNKLSISTEAWMDGRPASWTKHAYWLPNQFVEVNPIEYIEKRGKAVVSGLRFQQHKLPNLHKVQTFAELSEGGTHILWTRSSDSLPIPNNSVDLVLTDPPYGSNVQYGELSAFWLVWLRDELGLTATQLGLSDEVLVHRKVAQKTYEDYAQGLQRIFSECYRVLKPNCPLVFTFNNKDIYAWYSVVRAAIKSGFYLDVRGVIYQEPIENYKNTAHTRFAGSLHGDFIYTFLKTPTPKGHKNSIDTSEIPRLVTQLARAALNRNMNCSTSELYVNIFPKLIPLFVTLASSEDGFAQLQSAFGIDDIESILERHFHRDGGTGEWHE
jgi:adenine-specific DNA methylase